MREKHIGKTSAEGLTDWTRLRSLSDGQVRRALQSDPQARPTDAEFWKQARVVVPVTKQTISIRLDADLLEWLRTQKGHQTRINAVLRTYMDANLASGRRG
jgi:uncharacterized protein (DUF4415 family)